MAATMHVDIVSAESEIYSGEVQRVFAAGLLGDLEVAPGHAPLLTALNPGFVTFRLPSGADEVVYVSGGILEVQPNHVTVLADTSERADALDEAAIEAARQEAAKALLDTSQSDQDLARVKAELARAAGMIRAIQQLKKQVRR